MKKNIYKKTLLLLIPAAILAIPFFAGAQHPTTGGLVTCAGADDCNFGTLILMINKIMQYLLTLAAIVASILFAYAGFLYVFAAGSEGNIRKAHSIFWSAGLGLVFMAAAWLIVEVILQTLGATTILHTFF
jgi:hypothetical protein